MWREEEDTLESDEEEEGMLESDKQDMLLCIDPADFARNSAAHFARSLILYALKVKDECQDINSEHEEEEDDDGDDCDGESSEDDLQSDSDADGSEYHPLKPRKGQVARISASLEESTINVSDSDAMNIDVNLDGGEASVAPIPASRMNVDEGEALVSSIPVISTSQQSAVMVTNTGATDFDDKMGARTAKVENMGLTYKKLYSSNPWTIEGW
ncbi:hypothetical protein EV421DRAFT_1907968 [Armillaria borealis]|uniref:Uncharacterized protein n=1 Tax=Armillaria borealis TaxID=47425 RepID=A0AA39MIQ2_9AGAR|nr:hypothetical protein EV421DRAFT_1907968 [Armillaria borealis]